MNLKPEPALTREPTIQQDSIRYGYNGLATFRYMRYNTESKLSIYCVSDPLCGELDIIPLTIGCFGDLYQIIDRQLTRGTTVRILPMSIRFDYISDLINIVTLFNQRYCDREKPVVRWGFPDIPEQYTQNTEKFIVIEEFETSQDKNSVFVNQFEPSIVFSYYRSGVETLYDIVVQTGDTRRYFTTHMTSEKLYMLLNDETIDEIHMCGSESHHGGICGVELDVKNLSRVNGFQKIRFFNISSPSHMTYLEDKWLGHLPKERWEFI